MSGSKPRRARVRRARGSPGIGSSPRASPACLLSASIRSAPDPPTRPECRTSKAETAERRRASRLLLLLATGTRRLPMAHKPSPRKRAIFPDVPYWYVLCTANGRTPDRSATRDTKNVCPLENNPVGKSATRATPDAEASTPPAFGSALFVPRSQTSLVFVREQRVVRRRSLRSRRTRTALENNRRELGVRVVVPRVRAARHLLASAEIVHRFVEARLVVHVVVFHERQLRRRPPLHQRHRRLRRPQQKHAGVELGVVRAGLLPERIRRRSAGLEPEHAVAGDGDAPWPLAWPLRKYWDGSAATPRRRRSSTRASSRAAGRV